MSYYIALDNMNLDWEIDQVQKFDKMWREGLPINIIARRLKRPINEVAVLLFDRAEKGKVNPRTYGIRGGC